MAVAQFNDTLNTIECEQVLWLCFANFRKIAHSKMISTNERYLRAGGRLIELLSLHTSNVQGIILTLNVQCVTEGCACLVSQLPPRIAQPV